MKPSSFDQVEYNDGIKHFHYISYENNEQNGLTHVTIFPGCATLNRETSFNMICPIPVISQTDKNGMLGQLKEILYFYAKEDHIHVQVTMNDKQ